MTISESDNNSTDLCTRIVTSPILLPVMIFYSLTSPSLQGFHSRVSTILTTIPLMIPFLDIVEEVQTIHKSQNLQFTCSAEAF